jgi:hypothetical protein
MCPSMQVIEAAMDTDPDRQFTFTEFAALAMLVGLVALLSSRPPRREPPKRPRRAGTEWRSARNAPSRARLAA